jgi:hypothetical protein
MLSLLILQGIDSSSDVVNADSDGLLIYLSIAESANNQPTMKVIQRYKHY